MLGQFLGAFFAALCVWGNYADWIRIEEVNNVADPINRCVYLDFGYVLLCPAIRKYVCPS